MQIADTKQRLFRRFTAVTIIAVYLLIAIGGIVRSTGSGMGCPDWPKCFGSWVPPTSVDQLPKDYKEDYVQQRIAKNVKFAKYLTALGFDDLAYQVENDPSILEEEDFNAVKTWVEYVNRLIGAVIGLLIFGTFVLSTRYWKKDRPITVLSFIAFVLVGFQGWIGSIVVSTNLLQWMITIHMLLAILIVCLLIYVYFRSKRNDFDTITDDSSKLKWITIACLTLTLVQIVLGTQVREGIDEIAKIAARNEWIENLGLTFLIHRSYSIALLVLHVYLFFLLSKNHQLKVAMKWLVAIVGIEILSGAIMAYFSVPAFIQPIHLLLGTLIIGVQYYLLLRINHKKEFA
ncbi:COX15/CtaA family protein [Roseivirga misakiensis]|uniref:Cytochrome oxidase assembly protein n=1 Tax=Roseivirga misakiensis TaxID=1563681 RepID=A0A1E5T1R5_9BACT|nr:COX15/CtaA family protein [Roseivirga misakiensis]OEK05301.1 cytochrome oxidase assembly protein [Roseivirga misakiensis]